LTDADTGLELTGERTLPGIPRENYWFQRHLVAYHLAADMAAGRRVVDVGCGEGYGPAMLAERAVQVLGVDIAPEVVEHASGAYAAPNLSFEIMDVGSLELPAGSFDMAVSLQVVEHLVDESSYFREIVRVLEPGGTAIFSTPNRLTISPGSKTPINPFHLREYTPGEFHEVLEQLFETVEISGIFHARRLRLNEKVRLVDFINVYTMSSFNPRLWAHRLLTPHVRTSDFRVETSSIAQCLDIVAICRKEPSGEPVD